MTAKDAQKPQLIELDDPSVKLASPETYEIPDEEEVAGIDPITMTAPQGPVSIGIYFWIALIGLVTMASGIWIYDIVTDMLLRHIWLGRFALGLAVLMVLVSLILIARELVALHRIKRLDKLRSLTSGARESGDKAAALVVSKKLTSQYQKRDDMQWSLARLRKQMPAAIDGNELLDVLEQTLMEPLDQRALNEVKRGARDCAGATALIPLAVLDALAVLYINLRTIRAIASIYGGWSGWFGSWRLIRRVAAHLIATGAVALGDDLLAPLIGGSVAAKVSRRFGEGAINGALTARVGLAAVKLCRPMEYNTVQEPSLKSVILSALGLKK